MLASNPARILEQISRRARIPLTQESTSGDHALTRLHAPVCRLEHVRAD
jgi:hypothetical protein